VTVSAERPFEKIDPKDWSASLTSTWWAAPSCPHRSSVLPCAREAGQHYQYRQRGGHLPISRVVAYSAPRPPCSTSASSSPASGPRAVSGSIPLPRFFPAEQNRRLLFDENGKPTPRSQAILGHTPMGRFGQPSELVGAAIFLASSAASGFVTGTTCGWMWLPLPDHLIVWPHRALPLLSQAIGKGAEPAHLSQRQPEASIRGAAIYALEREGAVVAPLRLSLAVRPQAAAAAAYAKERARHATVDKLAAFKGETSDPPRGSFSPGACL